MNRRGSEELSERMREITPGGVSSPVRGFLPNPIFMDRGKGCMIWDVDGNEYTDLCMAYGPLILGHSPDEVVSAVSEQLTKGTVFGAPSVPEYSLIESIVKKVPCADMARLANSGAEATMHAIRLARMFTSKDRIVKIRGGFHGAHDAVLVNRDGAGYPGVPNGVAGNTAQVPFNDAPAMEKALSKNDVAAVIIEPVQGNIGLIPPEKGYLESVRKIARESDAVLIFDEVITGFRLSPGGAQEKFGVTPDLATYGKIIGGGYPIGAIAGKRKIMENIAPAGAAYMAGTFAGNPISAAAGTATLEKMSSDDNYKRLDEIALNLVRRIRDSVEDRRADASVVCEGSMFQIFFGADPPKNDEEAGKADGKRYDSFFRSMLDHGVYLPPSRFEVNFVSLAHGSAIDAAAEAFDACLKRSAL
ncbi:MAG: glutamate-1-semialdehyde 2,1-aminomutase [Candidatus Methanoplasma sp.]|jgi:glutamate-1-semialdehyde 2,1-aminomutase|nr:glutamate-1-semialdehyde 2,1-aminomutase [Candidatus Methanoplasma sp.]